MRAESFLELPRSSLLDGPIFKRLQSISIAVFIAAAQSQLPSPGGK